MGQLAVKTAPAGDWKSRLQEPSPPTLRERYRERGLSQPTEVGFAPVAAVLTAPLQRFFSQSAGFETHL